LRSFEGFVVLQNVFSIVDLSDKSKQESLEKVKKEQPEVQQILQNFAKTPSKKMA
jgi:hypothetical protein